MSELVAIFVHGLGATADSTWKGNPTLPQVAAESTGVEVGYYEYPTNKVRLNPFKKDPPRIQTLADGLGSYIDLVVDKEADILLVAHSLGGLIVKKHLVDEVRRGKPSRIKKALLYGTPNNGSDLANLARLFGWRNRQLRQLAKDSDFIRDLSTDWQEMSMNEKFDTLYVVGGQDRAVDQHSARSEWGGKNLTVNINADHTTLVRPLSHADLSATRLRVEIEGMITAIRSNR